ncbi:MAG: hypothetical protein WDM78_03950 [Puia sp.]
MCSSSPGGAYYTDESYGKFVPALRAKIPITDKIFTRVGASDNVRRRGIHIFG